MINQKSISTFLLSLIVGFFLCMPLVSVNAATGGVPTGNSNSGGTATGNSNSGGVPTGNSNNGGVPTGNSNSDTCTNCLKNPLKNINSLSDLLNVILSAVIEIGTIVLVLMLVYTGFKFVLAQGNAEELKNARSMLIWTVIGGLILLGAQAISAVIQATANSL